MHKEIIEVNNGEGTSIKVEVLPDVKQVRECRGFNPLDHLTLISFRDESAPHIYLEVVWRVQWFHSWVNENGKKGRIEEDPCVQIGNYIQTAARVYIDNELAGSGVGGILITDSNTPYAIQQAATIAKGRALANAGFGGVFSAALTSESGATAPPCDSGVKSSNFYRPVNLNETADEDDVPFVMAPEIHSEPETRKEYRSSVTDSDIPSDNRKPEVRSQTYDFTFEQARDFVIQIAGSKHNGKTLGVACAEDSRFLKYLLTNARYPALKSAAKVYSECINLNN